MQKEIWEHFAVALFWQLYVDIGMAKLNTENKYFCYFE